MRLIYALPLLLLGACEVTTDDANDTTTVEFNQAVAAEGARDVANEAGDIAGIIANDVSETADKVSNEVGDIDVDVDVDRDPPAPATNAN